MSSYQVPIAHMVDEVCESPLPDSNVALILEICDVVNSRGKQTPRECLAAILHHVNRSSTTTEALHALDILDYLVKNCSYPVHIIVATKEFLNELVRRFPEHPVHITHVQHRILMLIRVWKAVLCENSRYKRDFKLINDMYRLLEFKGYRFPELPADQAAALAVGDTIKTEEQLEQEDREAQGAKLEELLRLGTPAALAQANDLMKIMSGFVKDEALDYKREVDQQLERIEQKTILLNDMLMKRDPSSRYVRDVELDNIHGFVASAQIQIRKTLESAEDANRVAQLLELNNLINLILENYSDYKDGKPLRNREIPSVGITSVSADSNLLSFSSSAPGTQQGAISLIDFDDAEQPSVPEANTRLDSLLGTGNGSSISTASNTAVTTRAGHSSGGTGGMTDLLSVDFSSSSSAPEMGLSTQSKGGYASIPPNVAALLSGNKLSPPVSSGLSSGSILQSQGSTSTMQGLSTMTGFPTMMASTSSNSSGIVGMQGSFQDHKSPGAPSLQPTPVAGGSGGSSRGPNGAGLSGMRTSTIGGGPMSSNSSNSSLGTGNILTANVQELAGYLSASRKTPEPKAP